MHAPRPILLAKLSTAIHGTCINRRVRECVVGVLTVLAEAPEVTKPTLCSITFKCYRPVSAVLPPIIGVVLASIVMGS